MMRTTRRAFLQQQNTADVVIAGAGIMGCSIALHLGRQGRNVTVIDPNVGAGEGTTSYSSSVIRMFYSVPESAQCAWEGYQVWTNWQDYLQLSATSSASGSGNGMSFPTFRQHDGMILQSPRSAEFIHNFKKVCAICNIDYHELDKVSTVERTALAGWDITNSYEPRRLDDPLFDTPIVDDDGITGSVVVPTTGYVSDPRLATENLMAASLATGNVKYIFGRRVTGAAKEPVGGGVGRISSVQLSDGGCIATPVLVNATGPFSAKFNESIFDAKHLDDSVVKTKPLRAEVCIADAPPNVNLDQHGLIAPDFDVGVYLRPEFGNRILIGSLDPDCDTKVFETDPDAQDCAFTHMWEENMYRAGLRMPSLPIASSGRSAKGIVSMYDSTPDWTPVLDSSSIAGYYLAIGTNGNCFKNGPVFGEAVAQLIEHVEAKGFGAHDKNPMPFHLPTIGTSLDMGQFSRLRSLHNSLGGVCG